MSPPIFQVRVALRLGIVVAVIMTLVASNGATAQPLQEMQKIWADDGSTGDHFANSVAVHGDLAILGALEDTPFGPSSGSAYLFQRNGEGGWAQVGRIIASDGREHDGFGHSVAIWDHTAVVGAPFHDDEGERAGAAYVFERDANGDWQEVAQLTAGDDAMSDAAFGMTVSIEGGTIAVGAPSYDNASGAVYLFEPDGQGGWARIARLAPATRRNGGFFGWSISISGATLAVGAPTEQVDSVTTGVAYTFVREGADWIETGRFSGHDSTSFDMFGGSVALFEDTLIVGAARWDDPEEQGFNHGAAYIFERDGEGSFAPRAKVQSGEESLEFASAVGVWGDLAVVGSPNCNDLGLSAGAAHVFQRLGNGSWVAVQRLHASDGGANDMFGWAISMAGDDVIVSAWEDDVGGTNSGSAYLFRADGGLGARLTSIEVRRGEHAGGGRGRARASDDRRVKVNADFTGGQPPYLTTTEFDFETEVDSPGRFDLIIESRLSENGGTAKVFVRRWSASKWVMVAEYPIGKQEHTVVVADLSAARYINSQGEIRVRIRHEMVAMPFQSRIDLVKASVRE